MSKHSLVWLKQGDKCQQWAITGGEKKQFVHRPALAACACWCSTRGRRGSYSVNLEKQKQLLCAGLELRNQLQQESNAWVLHRPLLAFWMEMCNNINLIATALKQLQLKGWAFGETEGEPYCVWWMADLYLPSTTCHVNLLQEEWIWAMALDERELLA